MIFSQGKLTVSNLQITNSYLAFKPVIEANSYGFIDVNLDSLHFENITVNVETSLINPVRTNSLKITNSMFNNVKQVSTNDDSNIILNLGALNLASGKDFILSNLTAKDSSMTLLEVNNVIVAKETSNQISISYVVYKDSVFDFTQDLIVFGNIEEIIPFNITITSLAMSNLTFNRGGNLLLFQHQTASGVQILDSNFHDIDGGSIFIWSANLQNTNSTSRMLQTGTLSTKVTMKNITADMIDETFDSFIVNKEGGYLVIEDSQFTNINSIESGSVINGKYQKSVTLVYNSLFQNNTSTSGGVINIQDESAIEFYD